MSRDKTKRLRQVSFYIDDQVDQRMRAAYLYTVAREEYKSLSGLITRAIVYSVIRLEAQYNEGQPFAVDPGRGVPLGRPLNR